MESENKCAWEIQGLKEKKWVKKNNKKCMSEKVWEFEMGVANGGLLLNLINKWEMVKPNGIKCHIIYYEHALRICCKNYW